MSRKQHGFSLLELLVSMLIVSIAMLGFAALQAYSSRALSGSFTRASETAVFNDFIKLFQVSNIAVKRMPWNNNVINFTCDNADTALLYQGAAVTESSSLGRGVIDVCDQIDRAPGIVAHDIAFRLVRTETGFEGLKSYSLIISFAYIPKKAGTRTDQTTDVDPTVNEYCPVGADTSTEALNKKRVADGVVCSQVEVLL